MIVWLVYCHAGCSVHDVVDAVGLDLVDLFPPRERRGDRVGARPERHPIPADDVLRCLAREATYLLICAGDLLRGEAMTAAEADRLALAASRIRAGMTAGGIA